MKYTVEYFINKFTAIPEELWTTGSFEENGAYCALGHCGVQRRDDSDDPIWTEEGQALQALAKTIQLSIPCVNDGNTYGVDSIQGYTLVVIQGYTPKQRILNFLQVLKEGDNTGGTPEK